jgi:hypothetical protein
MTASLPDASPVPPALSVGGARTRRQALDSWYRVAVLSIGGAPGVNARYRLGWAINRRVSHPEGRDEPFCHRRMGQDCVAQGCIGEPCGDRDLDDRQ